MTTRIATLCVAILCVATTVLGLTGGTAAAAANCDVSAAPAVPVIKGLDYDHARAALLAAGWKPGHGSQFTDMSGNQSAFHDRGYTELQSCSFDSSAACHFNFDGPGNVVLRVTTQGDENPLLDSKAIVSGAELGCQE